MEQAAENTAPSPPSTADATRPGRSGWLPALFVALVTLAAFLGPLSRKEFINFGEVDLLTVNQAYQGLGLSHLSWAFGDSKEFGHYHPLTWLSYGLDYVIYGGPHPRGFYFTGLMLHVFSAVLLYFLAARLIVAAREGVPAAPGTADHRVRIGAACAALLFAVHPLRAESVAWLVERRDVLCGFFFLASILAYMRCRVSSLPGDDGTVPAQAARAARAWLIFSVVLGAAAILSKATAACLPLVLILLDFFPLGPSARRVRGLWWDRVPFLILGVIAAWNALIALQAFRDAGGTLLPDPEHSLGVRLGIALNGGLHLLIKSLYPIALGPRFELPSPDLSLTSVPVIAPIAIALAVTAVLVALWKRWPAGLVAWACFLVLLVPVSGLKFIGVPVDADRNSYLSCIPWAVLIGAGVCVALRRGRGAGVVAVVVALVAVAVLAKATWSQAAVWRDDVSFWTRMAEVNPEEPEVYNNLGSALKLRDDLEGAEQNYRRALEADARNTVVRYNLGTVLCIGGKYEEAVEHLRLAKLGAPGSISIRQNLSTALIVLRRYDEALAELLELRRLTPDSPRVLNDLGVAYYATGEYDQAISSFGKALQQVPTMYSAHMSLADCWLAKGQTAQAVAHLREAMRLAPNDPQVRRKLADLMAQSSDRPPATQPASAPADPRQRLADEIRRLRDRVNEDPSNALAHYDLANRLAGTGQVEEAIHHYRQAIARQPMLSNASYYLTMLLMQNQRFVEAASAAREGLSHSPNDTKLLGAMAWILAASPDESVRDAAESLRLAGRAVELEPDNPSLLEVLSMAQWVNGQTEEAIATIISAESLVQSEGEELLRDRLAGRRQSYERQRTGTAPSAEAGPESESQAE